MVVEGRQKPMVVRTADACDNEPSSGESPTIAAIAPWFGSKRTLAPRILEVLGRHQAYWEPFGGSLSVLLAKPPASAETVNDLHGDLINLCRVVQSDELAPQLFGRLYRTVCSAPLHREASERCRARGNHAADHPPDLERAYDYFVCCWNGRNGVAGTSSYNQGFCRRFTKNGGHAARRFASAVESIPSWWDRLRNVTILNEDAFGLLERIEDADGVAIYCDPPYLVKGARYVHDFASSDHERLAGLLGRFRRTRVVVSYYEDPRLAGLYPGWTCHRHEVTKAMVNQGMRDQSGATKVVEVLLVNRQESSWLF